MRKKSEKVNSHPSRPEELTVSSSRVCFWMCAGCGGSFERSASAMTKSDASLRCPSCTDSQGEKELADFIADLLPEDMEVLRNDRTILLPDYQSAFKPSELDVYIPELCLAFEFNGDYWHSDDVIREKKGMSAEEWHGWKKTESDRQGIDLFFVWESDWKNTKRRQTIEKYIVEIVRIKIEGRKVAHEYRLLKILSKR